MSSECIIQSSVAQYYCKGMAEVVLEMANRILLVDSADGVVVRIIIIPGEVTPSNLR